MAETTTKLQASIIIALPSLMAREGSCLGVFYAICFSPEESKDYFLHETGVNMQCSFLCLKRGQTAHGGRKHSERSVNIKIK